MYAALIAGRLNVVHSVTIHAHRRFRVALRKQLAMHAGLILAELVGAQRRVVVAHVRRVGVAFGAQRRNFLALDVAAKSGGRAHRA